MTDIVIVNRSTALSDGQAEAVIPALQAQIDEDWLKHWPGHGATLHFAGLHSGADPEMWPIYLYDHTDVPGAGGYHDDLHGMIEGKVFVADAMEYGESWTLDLSHEMLEMLADPMTNIIVPIPRTPLHCLQEVCDAVEADRYGYEKDDGVVVSDFVLPSYFHASVASENPQVHDFRGHLKHPAPALLSGGYLGIQLPDGHWTQIVKRVTDGEHAGRFSRRALREGRSAERIAKLG